MSTKQAQLPGQQPSFRISAESFKQDGNWLVILDSELGEFPMLEPGDHFDMWVESGSEKNWAGGAICTHFMSCFILNIPKFVLDKHHDPIMKNGMALYDELQKRGQARLSPATMVFCIGFRLMTGS